MTLENIRPYIRYARKLSIERGIYADFVIPYDCRLFYVAHSTGYIRFENATYNVTNGDLLLWNSGVKYSMEPTGKSERLEMLALNFDITSERSDMSIPISPDKENCYRAENCIGADEGIDELQFRREPLVFREAYFAEGFLLDIISEYDSARRFSKTVQSAKLTELLISLARTADRRKNDISDVIDYIRANPTERFTNVALGKRFGFHPNSLSRLFVLHTGQSLHSYVLDEKIRRAIGLLESSDMSISEIASGVGFDDSSYFTRLFASKVGCTPSLYRSGGKITR